MGVRSVLSLRVTTSMATASRPSRVVADDQMTEHAAESGPRRGHLRARQVIVQRKGDVVGPRLVHRAFGDGHHGARLHRVVTDHGSAPIGRFAEDERRLVAKTPGRPGGVRAHPDRRLYGRRAASQRCLQQILEPPLLALQLRRIGEILPVTSPTRPEMPTHVFHNGVGPISRICVPRGLTESNSANSVAIARSKVPPRTAAWR